MKSPTLARDDLSSERWAKLFELSYIDDVKLFWKAIVAFLQDIAPHRIAVVSSGYSTIVFQDGVVSSNADDGQILRIGQIYTDLGSKYVLGVSSIGVEDFRGTQAFYQPATRKQHCEQLTVLSVPEYDARGKIGNIASIVIYHEVDATLLRARAIERFQSHLDRIIRNFLARIAKIAVQVGLNDFASNLPIGMLLLDINYRLLFVNTEGYRQTYLWNVAPSVKVLSNYKTAFAVPNQVAETIKDLRFRWNQLTLLLLPDDPLEAVVFHPLNHAFSATIKAITDRSNPLAQPNFLVRYSVIAANEKVDAFETDDLDISLLAELTNAERKVALYVVRGYSNQEIARMLGRQTSTIKEHLTHIYTKLNVRSRTHLIGRLLDRSKRNEMHSSVSDGLPSAPDTIMRKP